MNKIIRSAEPEMEILIVEDSETQAKRLASLLESASYRVRIASNGAEGLAMARERLPTLIVSDIAMPVMDGFAMCSAIKQDERLREVPVILLTALNSLYDVIRGLDCGADNFIRKPFEGQYLIGRIGFILNNRAFRRDERIQVGMQINLGGQTHFINAERQQIFDLLISTYEEAIQLTEQLREQQHQIAHSYQSLEGLYRIAEALNPALTEHDVSVMALDRMLDLPGITGGAILLFDASGTLALSASNGAGTKPGTARCPDCSCEAAIAGGKLAASQKIARCQLLAAGPVHIAVPLAVGPRTLGIMNLQWGGEKEPVQDDYHVLDTAGKQIAIALERAQLFATMESLVTERTADLEAERNLLSAVVNTTGALVFLVDPEGCIVMYNAACENSLGWKFSEVAGRQFWEVFLGPADKTAARHFFADPDFSKVPRQIDSQWLARDGSVRRILWSTTSIRRQDNTVEYLLGTGLDVTELEGAKERVAYLNHFDALTGLPNQMLLREEVRRVRDEIAGGTGIMGLLLVRCERLPLIRETLGVSAEQDVLQQITARLKEWKSGADGLAKIDDITFAVLAARSGPDDLSTLARALVGLLDRPFMTGREELHLEPSIGIAISPTDGKEFDMLMQAAQAAARRAAANNDERIAFYRPELSRGVNERFKMESALRHALERDELRVHYQPQVDMRSGRIVGVEALIRWQHPELGMVPPGSFIGLAEETGLILPIGAWVLRHACMQLRDWRDAGLDIVPVAVNLSAKQFVGQIVDTVQAVLAETGLEPHFLELELTESLSMDDPENTFRILASLKEMGVLLAIDDFGTGYSNLNYLKRFPVDKLKLDQSFVRELTSDPDDLAIARAVIAMAHGLRLRVIAEGVETDGQLAFLASNDCDEMQGYLFSRPVPADVIATMLAEGRTMPLSKLQRRAYDKSLLLVGAQEHAVTVARVAAGIGCRLHTAGSAGEAFELMATCEIGVVMCGDRIEGMDSAEFETRIAHLHPAAERMVLGGHAIDEDRLAAALGDGIEQYEQSVRARRR
jgi:PAS domain S-box-containing protein/diguanylate cyclase (GGDEF)-like protein